MKRVTLQYFLNDTQACDYWLRFFKGLTWREAYTKLRRLSPEKARGAWEHIGGYLCAPNERYGYDYAYWLGTLPFDALMEAVDARYNVVEIGKLDSFSPYPPREEGFFRVWMKEPATGYVDYLVTKIADGMVYGRVLHDRAVFPEPPEPLQPDAPVPAPVPAVQSQTREEFEAHAMAELREVGQLNEARNQTG